MNIKIRKWKESDAKALALVLNNKKIHDNLRDGLPLPYTENDALEYIMSMLNANDNDVFAFAIIFNNEVAGSIGAFRQGNIHYRTAEIGYYIAENSWGKGIATNVITELSEYIFENTDIVRIFALPFANNTGSTRALEKSGFQLEGILKNNAVKNGEIVDCCMYARIKA